MKRNQKLMLAGLTMLGLIGVGLLRTLEQVPETHTEPPSPEAQRNGFLAAQRTIEKLGVPWQEIRGLPAELSDGAGVVLVWPAPRGSMPASRLSAVERFLQSGGHLIVESEPWSDPLLMRFGIDQVEPDASWSDACGELEGGAVETGVSAPDALEGDAGPFATPEPIADDQTALEPAPETDAEQLDCSDDWADSGSDVYATGSQLGKPQLHIHLHGVKWLVSDAPMLAKLGPPNRPRLVQRAVGDGRLTAVISLDPLRNDELGNYDHAEVLHRLILQQPAQRVLFVRAQPGGLGSWLREYAWRVLAAAAVLLVLALWSTMPRFGPVAADPLPLRRRLLDHLLASGRLLWSRGEHRVLATAAVESALRRLRSEYPHTRWMPPAELAMFLQRRFQLDAAVVSMLLVPGQVHTPAALITLVRACQRIHSELAPRRAERASNPLYDQ